MVDPPPLSLEASPRLLEWMSTEQLSIVFTSPQAGKVFLLGLENDERASIVERSLRQCSACWSDGQTLWISAREQLWKFENVLPAGETRNGYDRIYAPRMSYLIGDVGMHDLAINAHGKPLFAASLFSCLATVSDSYSFTPVWKPPFVDDVTAEDRCHLNGFAMRDGEVAFATACSRSNAAGGWKQDFRAGGIVLDVPSGEVICDSLCMPRAPRWHNDHLWLLESGTGYLGYLDPDRQVFEKVAFCQGHPRGLSFIKQYAVVTISTILPDSFAATFPVVEQLKRQRARERCALLVIDLESGEIAHWLRMHGVVNQLFDVAILPNVRRPFAFGFKSDDIGHVFSLDPHGSI